MTIQEVAIIKELLNTPKKIVIIPHKNPDGDALGSTLALNLLLKSKGHDSCVISPNEFPDFLKWIPGANDIIKYDYQENIARVKITEADIIFTLDFNNLDRVDNMKPLLQKVTAPFVMIDHHELPDNYAVVTFSDTSMSSTCEMVYRFIDYLEETESLTAEIATCLYTGIMTDTGSFRYPSTTAQTHEVVSKLIEKGANNAQIHNNIYDTSSESRLHLLGKALENLKILPEYNTAYITLSRQELEQHDFKKGDTEGFVNYGLSVSGIKFALIFIENTGDDGNYVKISLRSKGDFDVNVFSRNHFNGGGHKNAAGGRSNLSLPETVTYLENILADYKTQLEK